MLLSAFPGLFLHLFLSPLAIGSLIIKKVHKKGSWSQEQLVVFSYPLYLSLHACSIYLLSYFNVLHYNQLILLTSLVTLGCIFKNRSEFLDLVKCFCQHTVNTPCFWLVLFYFGLFDWFAYDIPFKDYFAGMHFFQGADNIAQFSFVNPFNTDSYLPHVQDIYASASSIVGIPALELDTMVGYLFLLIQYFYLDVLGEQLFNSRRLAGTFACVFLITTNQPLLSNTVLCLMGLVAIFLVYNDLSKNIFDFNAPLSAILFLIVLKWLDLMIFASVVSEYKLIGICALVLVVFSLCLLGPALRYQVLPFLLVVSTYSFHRSALVFLLLLLCGLTIYQLEICKSLRTLKIVQGASILICGASVVILLFAALLGANLINPENGFLRAQLVLFARIFPDSDHFQGVKEVSYIRNGLIETVRFFSPFKLLLLITSVFVCVKTERKKTNIVISIFAVSIGMLMLSLMVPYSYRLIPLFSVVFYSILIDFGRLVTSSSSNKNVLLVLLVTSIVSVIYFGISIGISRLNQFSAVASELRYCFIIVPVAVLIGVVTPRFRNQLFFASVITLLITEALFIRIALLGHSYGYSGTFPISHLNANDFDCSRNIKSTLGERVHFGLIVSDPHTLVNYSTLLNAVPSYFVQNLEDVNCQIEPVVRTLLNRITKGEKVSSYQVEQYLPEAPRLISERRAIVSNRLNESYPEYFVIINNHTLSWLKGKRSYFPDNGPISKSLIRSMARSYPKMLTIDEKCLVIKLE